MLRTPLRALSGHSGVVIAADWLPGGEQVSNISAISTKKCLEFRIHHDFYNIPILLANILKYYMYQCVFCEPHCYSYKGAFTSVTTHNHVSYYKSKLYNLLT